MVNRLDRAYVEHRVSAENPYSISEMIKNYAAINKLRISTVMRNFLRITHLSATFVIPEEIKRRKELL